ncbi:MAG: hypothetical protein ACUZ8N_15385 [Candidatus Scalindua sp.]
MEKDNIEIIDYLRIIWKRKILIIVGVLVGMVAGLVMVLRAPELYRAEILLSMGKRIVVLPSGSFLLEPFDTAATIVKVIQAKYYMHKERTNKYVLKSEVISGTNLIRITLAGVDRKAVESFDEVMKNFCDEHSRKTESSLRPLYAAIEKLKVYQRDVLEEVARSEIRLNEFESDNDNIANVTTIIAVENRLWRKKTGLRDIQLRLMFYEAFVKNVDEYRTKIIGDMNKMTNHSNKRSNVIKAGGLGLVISLFLAFFIEYIGRTKKIEREKKGDTGLG